MPVDVLLSCPECHRPFAASRFGNNVKCANCRAPMNKLEQLRQLLAHWYYPRRWRADLVEPSAYFLIEKLWTANGQGERLYEGISPPNVNFDIFRHLVTRAIARGIQEGWMDLTFPKDPLEENPVYQLKFKDPDRFAREIEALFPQVNWDEQIQVPVLNDGEGAMEGGKPAKAGSGKKAKKG